MKHKCAGVVLSCSVNDLSRHPDLISSFSTLPEPTLCLKELRFYYGLQSTVENQGQHLSWNTEQSNATIFVTVLSALLLVEWDQDGILPLLRHSFCSLSISHSQSTIACPPFFNSATISSLPGALPFFSFLTATSTSSLVTYIVSGIA